MATRHLLLDGDVLDLIVFNHYGFLKGSLEEVLEANKELLAKFDLLGNYRRLDKTESYLVLPDLKKPTEPRKIVRLFD